MSYLLSKLLGKLFVDPTNFYAQVAQHIRMHPEMSYRNDYWFAIVLPDGGSVRFWIGNEFYGFTRNESQRIPLTYKAMVYDAIRETADYKRV